MFLFDKTKNNLFYKSIYKVEIFFEGNFVRWYFSITTTTGQKHWCQIGLFRSLKPQNVDFWKPKGGHKKILKVLFFLHPFIFLSLRGLLTRKKGLRYLFPALHGTLLRFSFGISDERREIMLFAIFLG